MHACRDCECIRKHYIWINVLKLLTYIKFHQSTVSLASRSTRFRSGLCHYPLFHFAIHSAAFLSGGVLFLSHILHYLQNRDRLHYHNTTRKFGSIFANLNSAKQSWKGRERHTHNGGATQKRKEKRQTNEVRRARGSKQRYEAQLRPVGS